MHARLGETRNSWRSSKVRPTLLDFSFLDVSFAAVNGYDHDVVDQVLGDIFIFEGNESKATRLSCVYIFQNAGVNNLTILLEMLFKLLYSKLEI
jgi:hypothetical protein